MRVDPARHQSQPWRIHTLAPDFELLDVWNIPIEADPDRGETFDEFFDIVWENALEAGSTPVRVLVRLRAAMGHVFGWERRDLTIPGSRERTVAERLSDDDRQADQAPEPRTKETAIERVHLVYRFRDEALLEINNATIAALLHLGWVDLPGGKKGAELAVYIKSRGPGSRLYMSAIEPFRYWFVYPAWTAHVARLWRDRRTVRARTRSSSILPDPSVARRVDREMFLLLGGTAALLMQVAHPLVALGVEQHSDFRRDPFGRLLRTLNTTLAVAFGDDRDATAAIDRMDRIHARVRGVTKSGHAYRAMDPDLLLWVQSTLVLTSLRLYELVMGRLPPGEREAYWSETKPIAEALGIPSHRLPPTLVDLELYEAEMLERDVVPDATARAVGRDVLRPFRWLPEIIYWPSDTLAAALLPGSLRAAFGLRYGTPERLFFHGVVVALRWLRRLLPGSLTVVPQARRYERASDRQR